MDLYLDCAASAPVFPNLLSAEEQLLCANPGTQHRQGQEAAQRLRQLRRRAAQLFATAEEQVVFCSGATEANNLALYNYLLPKLLSRPLSRPTGTADTRLVACYSPLDHPSVVQLLHGLKPYGLCVQPMSLAADGSLRLTASKQSPSKQSASKQSASKQSASRQSIFEQEPYLLCTLTAVDGESGRKQDLCALAQQVQQVQQRRQGAGLAPLYLHADLSQYLPCEADWRKLGPYLQTAFDSIALSGQKIGGGRGAGLLLQRRPAPWSLSQGGGQEGGQRSGTQNLSAIIALLRALEHTQCRTAQQQGGKDFVALLAAYPQLRLQPPYRTTQAELFSPFIFSLAAPPLPAEVLQRLLSERGYMVGTGSACHSAAKGRADKLRALGYQPQLLSSLLRISFGNGASQPSAQELRGFLDCLSALQRQYQ